MDTSKTIIYYLNKNGLENAIINVYNEKWLTDFLSMLIKLKKENIDTIKFDNECLSNTLLFGISLFEIKTTENKPYYIYSIEKSEKPILILYINIESIIKIIECIDDFLCNTEPRHIHISLFDDEMKEVELEISFRERENGDINYKYAFIINELENLYNYYLINNLIDYKKMDEIFNFFKCIDKTIAGNQEREIVQNYILTKFTDEFISHIKCFFKI